MTFLSDVSTAGPSLMARVLRWSEARRDAEARRMIYLKLLVEDDHRLTDLGVTREDVAHLLRTLDRR